MTVPRSSGRAALTSKLVGVPTAPTTGKGPEEWHGQFEDATPEHILEVGEATLILPSGEQGEIVITEYAYRLTGSGRGAFEGRGPVPA